MRRPPRRLPGSKRQRGLSLLELMIAMSIGLFLLLGVATVFVNSNTTYTELGRAAQQIENGRYAIQVIADDVALAGHYGRYSGAFATPGSAPDPCETADMAAIRAAMALPLQGYDAPGTSPLSCIPSANHLAGTDILVVRRADTLATAVGSLAAPQVYVQATADPTVSSANPALGLGVAGNFTLTNRDGTTLAPIRKYRVHVYFVAPCSIPAGGGTTCTGANDDGGNPIPTLKRLELTVVSGALSMQQVSLVEGIENFQIDYGVDSDNDGVPNTFSLAPALADWPNVVVVQANILARNLEATTGYSDPKTYSLGLAGSVTPAGAYKRHAYNSVIRVVNPSSRRES